MTTATTVSLTILTLVALVATVASVVRLRVAGEGVARWSTIQKSCIWICTLGSLAMFGYESLISDHAWQPLAAHVDGLLLISALLGGTILYLQHPSRLPGVGAFAGPLLTILLAWAICASAWTLEWFTIGSVWKSVHLASVYVGTLFFAVAAVSGGMYLYGQRRLRRKDAPAELGRFASLEKIETLIIRTSALGFGLLTLGLVTGLIIVTSEPTTKLGAGWWHSPKVVLAAVVWLVYALVMNVRHATSFRGARAAWLSIAGLVLFLAAMAIAIMPSSASDKPVGWALPTHQLKVFVRTDGGQCPPYIREGEAPAEPQVGLCNHRAPWLGGSLALPKKTLALPVCAIQPEGWRCA